jgi:hypothetical protein
MLVFSIPMRLPDLNELIASSGSIRVNRFGQRVRGSKYTSLKDRYGKQVAAHIQCALNAQCGGVPELPDRLLGTIRFDWRERERRRDPDNIAAGGTKLILDAMKDIGLISSDGWKLYKEGAIAILHAFHIDKSQPGVTVTLVYPPSTKEGTAHEGSQDADERQALTPRQGCQTTTVTSRHRNNGPSRTPKVHDSGIRRGAAREGETSQ